MFSNDLRDMGVRSERARQGNVMVRKFTGKITLKTMNPKMYANVSQPFPTSAL